jgi:hypothetical protein
MAMFRGLLQGLFGKKPKHSFYRPKWPDTDLAEVVRDAAKKGHDGVILHGFAPKAAGLRPLLELKGLKAIDLRDAALVTDDHLAELAPLSQQLEWLDLAGTAVNGAGLVKLGPMPALAHLDLSRTRVVDVAVLVLRRYPALTTLDLSGTRVTSGALQHLKELQALKELRLTDLGLEQSAKEAFAGRKDFSLVCAVGP